MKIILLSFFLFLNFSTLVISCPSSGDGDCVPSTDNYKKDLNKSSNQSNIKKSIINTPSSYESNNNDPGLPDDYKPKKSAYLKEISKKSKLNSEIQKLNFEFDTIIYNSLNQYNSNFSNEINDKLYDVNKLILQNKNIDKSFFNSLHQNIDKLFDTIIYSFNNNNPLILKPYTKNDSDMLYQINKYNEINDIIKTLEVMN